MLVVQGSTNEQIQGEILGVIPKYHITNMDIANIHEGIPLLGSPNKWLAFMQQLTDGGHVLGLILQVSAVEVCEAQEPLNLCQVG